MISFAGIRKVGGREEGRENGPAMNPNIGSSEIASSYGEYAKRAGRDDNFRTKVKSKKDEEEEEDSALLRVYSILHSLKSENYVEGSVVDRNPVRCNE